MIATILLTLLICGSSGVHVYFFLLIRKTLIKNKIRMSQQHASIKSMHEKLALMDHKIDSLILILNDMDIKSSSLGKGKDTIEHQYERAKRILKNGLIEEKDLLNSCRITKEEMELLSELMDIGQGT